MTISDYSITESADDSDTFAPLCCPPDGSLACWVGLDMVTGGLGGGGLVQSTVYSLQSTVYSLQSTV